MPFIKDVMRYHLDRLWPAVFKILYEPKMDALVPISPRNLDRAGLERLPPPIARAGENAAWRFIGYEGYRLKDFRIFRRRQFMKPRARWPVR